jgi:hypothetical protein
MAMAREMRAANLPGAAVDPPISVLVFILCEGCR